MKEEIESFLKEAFRIDGECKEEGSCSVVKESGEIMEGMSYKLTDSIRGVFYLTGAKAHSSALLWVGSSQRISLCLVRLLTTKI